MQGLSNLKRLTITGDEPITLSEVKQRAFINTDDYDPDLSRYLVKAREEFEAATQRSLIASTYRFCMFDWQTPSWSWVDPVYLPIAPITSIDSIKYYAQDNTYTTLDSSNYYLDTSMEPNCLRYYLTFGRPFLSYDHLPPIEIEFTAGSSLDQTIKDALLLRAYDLFNEEGESDGWCNTIDNYRLRWSPEWNEGHQRTPPHINYPIFYRG